MRGPSNRQRRRRLRWADAGRHRMIFVDDVPDMKVHQQSIGASSRVQEAHNVLVIMTGGKSNDTKVVNSGDGGKANSVVEPDISSFEEFGGTPPELSCFHAFAVST